MISLHVYLPRIQRHGLEEVLVLSPQSYKVTNVILRGKLLNSWNQLGYPPHLHYLAKGGMNVVRYVIIGSRVLDDLDEGIRKVILRCLGQVIGMNGLDWLIQWFTHVTVVVMYGACKDEKRGTRVCSYDPLSSINNCDRMPSQAMYLIF